MSAIESDLELDSNVVVIQTPTPEKPLPKWVKCSDVALVIEKPNLTFEEWQSVMNDLFKRDKRRQWLIGDGLNIGEAEFGDPYLQVIDPNDEAEKDEEGGETYRQYQQVACRIPAGSRLPNVSWGHHQVVAYLEPDRRDYWLNRLATEKISRHDLRRAVRREKRQSDKQNTKQRQPKVKELDLIHSEEAQAYFDQYLDALKMLDENAPQHLPSAHMMNHSQQGQVSWQRNRTIEEDCLAIVEMFSGKESVVGVAGVERASDSDISVWLNRNGYFMSDYDLDERLDLMVDKKMLDILTIEDSRQENRRGVMGDIYRLNPDYAASLEDED